MSALRLDDIAKRAGVSVAAVSIALNDPHTKRVGPEKRKEILRIAADLGYAPNGLAKALAEQRTRIVGLMVPLRDPIFFNHFIAQALSGIQATLKVRGYNLLVYSPSGRPGRATQDQILESRFTDGLIYINTRSCTTRDVAETIAELDAAKIKFSMMNAYYGRAEVNYVGADDPEIGRMAVNHLVERGHRRIAFLSGSDKLPTHIHLLQGLNSSLERYRLTLPPEMIGCTGYDQAEAFRILDRWFMTKRQKPSAIFCADDQLLIHLYDYLEARGLNTPRDVAVLARGVSSVLELLRPRPTGIFIPTFEMGKLAANMLIDSLETPEQERRRVLLPSTLRLGQTT